MLMVLPALIVHAAVAVNVPRCWPEPRLHHPPMEKDFRDKVEQRLQLRRVTENMPKGRTLSPNGAYAFHEERVQRPDGSSVVTVKVFTESDELLEVRAENVKGVNHVQWVNEKLLFLRVWIGRLGGADVILDVERDRIILMETVMDGRLDWEQARASCTANPTLRGCTEPCVRP